MRGKKSGLQAGACADKEITDWQKGRMTRALRLAKNQLADAMASLVQATPKAARWYCMAVRGGHELAVEKNLLDAGVEVFVARERWSKVKKGVKIEGERAMLPGYMLVRIVPSAGAFHGLKQQDGVSDFVGGALGYYVVRDADVAVLKAISDSGDVCRMPVDRSIGQGQRARIHKGAFAGHECVVVQVTAARVPTARVWLGAFGQHSFDVTMPLAFLEKL